MRILIIGASGSGVTTLGNALARELNIPYFDADFYYWEETDPPFQVRRQPAIRDQQLAADLQKETQWMVGGSLDSWGHFLKEQYKLVIYLWIPREIRAIRLVEREKERYGEVISQSSQEFIDWALSYDDSNQPGRNKKRHELWLQTLTCPVLRIEGAVEVKEKVELVRQQMSEVGKRETSNVK
jgi:adenylate kinase family enzyme